VHRHGDEAAWWRKVGVDPTVAARALWLEMHPMATGSDVLLDDVVDRPAAHPMDCADPKRGRRVGGRKAKRKSKPGEDMVPNGVA